MIYDLRFTPRGGEVAIYDLIRKRLTDITYWLSKSEVNTGLESIDSVKPANETIVNSQFPNGEKSKIQNLKSKILNHHVLVLTLYTLLTVFYLGPLIEHFFDNVPFGGDSWIFYWDLWWVKKALVELQTSPFYTTYVNFPQGASLNFHTLAFMDGLLALPLQLLGMSLPGAYNSLVLFGYIFSAYGMYLLADYVVGYRPGAFVAGLIFGFSPFHSAHLNGQLNFVSIQWMPFYILFMLKTIDVSNLDKRGRVNLGLAALFLALNALTEWTLAAFLVLFTLLYGLYRVWQGRREWRTVLRGPVLRLGLILFLFGVLTLPVLLPMINEIRTNKNIKYDPDESVLYSADLLSFVMPYELHPILGEWAYPHALKYRPLSNSAERTSYLGLTVLLLALLGAWFYRRRGAGLWLLSALSFIILALGPQLSIGGRAVFTVFKLSIPLPYAALYYLPFFSIMRTPGRFVLLAMLALAVLAAFGLKALNEKLAPRLKEPNFQKVALFGLSGLAALLLVFEFAPYITTAYPNVPAIYDPLRRDNDARHAVLELPLRPAAHFYIAQVAHQKPLIGGYLARQIDNPLVEQVPALKTLALRNTTPDGSASQLREASIRYVVVNWWMLDADQQTKMRLALQQVFNRPPDDQEMEPDGSRLRISLYKL